MRRYWTQAEIDILRRIYPQEGATGTRRALKASGYTRSLASIMAKARLLETIYQGAPKKWFKHGNIPHNKGKKMPESTRAKIKTMFQPGNTPANAQHDGAISIRDTNRRPTVYLRLGPRKWVNYARYTWEQAYGLIPAGHVITMIDGNSLNCAIENLQIISRKQNMARNLNRAKSAKTNKVRGWTRRKLQQSGLSFVDAVLQGIL